MEKEITKNKTGTTAFNRPNQPMIHYSAKGYEEYRADLTRRLMEKGFVLKDDDFLNAFIDITSYLGEVLMTYQNAYAQEIYLDTAQLRETLFNLAAMVDYRVDPGASAIGKIVVMAKPEKGGLLPMGTLVSGKEEGAKKAVFFETDTDLNVDARFNEFTLAATERFDEIEIAVGSTDITITVQEKIIIKPGQYIYFYGELLNLFAQVQSSTVNEKIETTTVSFMIKYPSNPSSFKAGSGEWGLINNEARGLLKLAPTPDSDPITSDVWLDNKYENIAKDSPIILRYDASEKYGIVESLSFDTLSIKAGVSTRISGGHATSLTEAPDKDPDEEQVDSYVIDDPNGQKKFFILQKTLKESLEVSKLTVTWLNVNPGNYNNGADPTEKSSTHIVFVGIQSQLNVKDEKADEIEIQGNTTLTVDGDFSDLEKYRTLILHEVIDGIPTTEVASLLDITISGSGNTAMSIIELKDAVSSSFTRNGVKIWGNVVKITQGKTVPGTILGSGRGEESYQAFELPQSPLTYERRGREGIKGAIEIKVSELPWHQKDDFLYSKSADHHYIIETGYDGKSRVVFGDGFNGGRLPTGRDNVLATFRTGQGTLGNVSRGVVKKPVKKPPFLDKILNPDNTAGGSNPDTEEQLREKIPVEHLTFDRAVSLHDYADLALSYPGIGKAKAGWRWYSNKKYVVLAVTGEEGEDVSLILQDLRDHLDARRDVNQPLIVKEADTILITLSIVVITLPGSDREKVEDAVYEALGTGVNNDGTLQFFHFDLLNIGMSIHKKEIYHVVENIPGVDLITNLVIHKSFQSVDTGYFIPSLCSNDVWINNWELAKLNVAELDIVVNQPTINKLCERSGG